MPTQLNHVETQWIVIISHADSILVAADTMTKKEVKLVMDGCVRLGGVWWGVGVCGGWQGRGGVVGSGGVGQTSLACCIIFCF